jgi:hypothetical protein
MAHARGPRKRSLRGPFATTRGSLLHRCPSVAVAARSRRERGDPERYVVRAEPHCRRCQHYAREHERDDTDISMPDTMPDLGTIVSISAITYGLAALAGIVAVALAPLLTLKRLRRTDIPSALRVVE